MNEVGDGTLVMLGRVRSIVTGVEVCALLPGPLVAVTVPYTEFAVNCGMTVPSPQELAVNVKLVPDSALIEKEQPVAVPAFEKSLLAMPVTF